MWDSFGFVILFAIGLIIGLCLGAWVDTKSEGR
jgi:hypothetical protein